MTTNDNERHAARAIPPPIARHQDLVAWRTAIDLVKDVYRVSAKFPKEEIYGLSSQMRRAAVSIPSNIAEGAARGGTKEFIHFLCLARGSLAELETQLYIARELKYLDGDGSNVESKLQEMFRLISGLILSLKRKLR